MLILTITAVSCYRAQDCTPVTRDYVIIDFVDSLGAAKEKTFTITSAASDSILVSNSVTSSKFELPLDPFSDNVTFTFTETGTENWLTLGYRNAVFINSEDCGPEFVFSELVIWGSTYDSLRLIDNRVLDGIELNVRIYEE